MPLIIANFTILVLWKEFESTCHRVSHHRLKWAAVAPCVNWLAISWTSKVMFMAGDKIFSLYYHAQYGPVGSWPSCPIVSGLKQLGECEADLLSPSRAEVYGYAMEQLYLVGSKIRHKDCLKERNNLCFIICVSFVLVIMPGSLIMI